MGILQHSKEQLRAPIGRIVFHLQTSLYRKKEGGYEKVRDYLKIGETRNIIDVADDYIEIQDGYFIKNIKEPQYTMTFGEIIVTGENVKTCSKNGIFIRKLKLGLKLKIDTLIFISNDVTVYGINNKEFISSDENVQYVLGTFEFNSDANMTINGQTIKYRKGDSLQYQKVEGTSILLLDGEWLDVSSIKGTLFGC
ncbi:hypothetical protein ACOMCU_16055 [Lysinibacillus sp. UGB7]|uniref:hypothetical protein n=1 Tax=Lysinibacillus sp. UGB7 TaxID=3411039 RepID=UPI003B7BBC3F